MKGDKAVTLLEEIFGPGSEPVVAWAPGRVNLIGEHTDYNGGYVLPFAVDRYTRVALRRRDDTYVRVYTASFEESFSARLPLRNPRSRGDWSDYVVGILREFSAIYQLRRGFDAAIVSDVPLGVGLSSSASLEVAFAVGLVFLYELGIGDLELVELCQRAERDFVGMPCGIMDQYAVYFGEHGKALFLDTLSLEHRVVPLELEGVNFLVVNSNVRRVLADSGYAQRRRECYEATRWLARRFPERGINSLRGVDPEMLEKVRAEMPRTLWKRAVHVIAENGRVLAMVEALRERDTRTVGELLYASHVSLRDLFEVSVPEVDFLVEWGISHGALGARIVGGGFGGATLHLVPAGITEDYVKELVSAYRRRWNLKAEVLEIRPSAGAWGLLRTR